MKEKRLFFLLPCMALVAITHSARANPPETAQFTSRVYFLIHDTTPRQMQRSRKLIERQFADTFATVPQLQRQNYHVVSDGNELVFSLVTETDMHTPFHQAASDTVGQLNGLVGTRGRIDSFRTRLENPPDGYLEVVLDDEPEHKKPALSPKKPTPIRIRSVVARSIPLRDLLAELKLQFEEVRMAQARVRAPREDFSYMVPGECAARPVDWSFATAEEEPPKTIQEAMNDIARVFHLNVEQHRGTYIFSGDCPQTAARRRAGALEFLPARWVPLRELPGYPTPLPRPAGFIPVGAALE